MMRGGKRGACGGLAARRSGGRMEPHLLPPLLEADGAEALVLVGGEEVTVRAEVVVYGAKGLQELLHVRRGFEPLQHALSLAHRSTRRQR